MTLRVLTLSLVAGLFAGGAQAATFGFVNAPTTNSTDWATDVASRGGTVNSNVDFEAHPLGALIGNFYAMSDGVTLTPGGDVNTVQNTAGPGQGNTSTPPLSPGEGPTPVSHQIFDGGQASSLTIDFASAVMGFGLFVSDYFNPNANNPLTLEAFSGAGGTGASLGLFSSVAVNFQANNSYFMGLTSDANDIRSVVFTDVNSNTGDTISLDRFVFATAGGAAQVPLPMSLPLLGAALAGLGLVRRRT